jgi:hypothetical protein
MTHRTRRAVPALLARTLAAIAITLAAAGAAAQPAPDESDRPSDQCLLQPNRAVRLFEVRAPDRVEEDLLLVDGINLRRDVLVVACTNVLLPRLKAYLSERFGAAAAGEQQRSWTVVVEVRAWHKPREGGWREMRLNEPPAETAASLLAGGFTPDRWNVELIQLVIRHDTVLNPTATIPLRRDAVNPNDLVRIHVRARLAAADDVLPSPPPPPPPPNAPRRPPSVLSENEDVIDNIYEVGRFGLHVRFSDLVVFVQRLGEDRANADPDEVIAFDPANFRPAPGASYGFTFYDRRRAFLRFLEPGFGAHLTFLNWTDRSRAAPPDPAQVTALQLGVGVMGSMFDGTVVAVFGSNLHVKDHRPYFGVGFSVTGLVRKLSLFLDEP